MDWQLKVYKFLIKKNDHGAYDHLCSKLQTM